MITNLASLFLCVAFISTSMWGQIKIFLTHQKPKDGDTRSLSDSKYLDRVKAVGGFNLHEIKIVRSDKPYGLMVGLPGKPIMIFSSSLLETFNEDEIDWVLLHESAHYKLAHGIRELMISLLIIVLTSLLFREITQVIPVSPLHLAIAFILGFMSGLTGIQIGRLHEYEADRFAAKNMRNPEGMISGTKKLRAAWRGDDHNDNGLLQKLFIRGVSDSERVRIATEEIKRRESIT